MDIMPLRLLVPLGNVEPILNDQEMSFLHQASLQQMAEVLEDDYQKTPFSFKSKEITTLNNFNSSVLYDKPNLGTSRLATNFLKVENEDAYTTKQVSVIAQCAANSPKYLSFGNPDSLSDLQQLYINGIGEEKDEMNFLISKKPKLMNHDISSFQASGRASMGNNPHSSSHDHMIAERKRREKLNEQFLSLSAIIPGLAKTDKASLLVSTINYLKELVTKVKSLEQSIIDGPVESAMLMKDDKASLITNESSSSDPLFKIEAKLTGNIIVLKFQCKNLKGLAIKALSEIEKLFLTIIDLSIMPFSSSSLDVVVMAKVEDGFSLTVKELVEKLSSFFSQFI
ncbi:transcription factor bHLH18-like [Dioscorea cayenensis subsp. rotundata]|uniref:Transcription factor bHLH18-like n=1 Tax=Dioscorea cayennensis subsp. rotundata TaxID=55577 RepID=A0AB40CDS9_DIOCR|nr:transcription factor bHLH18-like [Dioscorea cayenensis subsp. rotundata]XP_039136935.1 transcription factor bHLH18-like [Dioscorea cayenensis subsp. rotundata]XP_039136936.1 transcription factor bHLH18-like [Dioscorea cayenensis subsp. rotundata]